MCRRGGCLFCGCFFFLNLFATYVLVDVVVLNFVHPARCWSIPLLVVSLQNFVSGNQIFPIKKRSYGQMKKLHPFQSAVMR
jgi:uncharacterized integral membrane protein